MNDGSGEANENCHVALW